VVEGQASGRGQIVVSFLERKRRKTYFFGKADEEVCWETWVLDVTCATPRTDAGIYTHIPFIPNTNDMALLSCTHGMLTKREQKRAKYDEQWE
jgi:hypothetical protein